VAVPAGSRFAVGDQVAGITSFLTGWGGYADYTYLSEISMMHIPAGVTDEQAGGFPIGFRTAYAGLIDRVPVEAGQTLLVLGAAGSSGIAAVQLGKALGAMVIAVAGSREKLEFCGRYGADHAVSHRADDMLSRITEITSGRGVDVIYDPVGGQAAATATKALARNGRIAIIGLASGAPVPLDPMDMLLRNYAAVGVLATPHEEAEKEAAVWERLGDLAGRHAITTPVGTVYGFEDVPDMITEQSSPRPGKSVVRIASR
jgi:NADPH:quinone reductase